MVTPKWGYLANLCNSTIIEIYSDMIRVSHGFRLFKIAAS